MLRYCSQREHEEFQVCVVETHGGEELCYEMRMEKRRGRTVQSLIRAIEK